MTIRVPYRPSNGTKTSNAWSEVQTHLKDRLNDLRRDNDNAELDAVATAALRGKISEIKRLIDLDNDRPEVTVSAD